MEQTDAGQARHEFPDSYWKGETGREHSRAVIGSWVRELGLEGADAVTLHDRLTYAGFIKRGLAGMLTQVYAGRKVTAILDYLQRPHRNAAAWNYPRNSSAPRPSHTPRTHSLSLRFLGGVEVAIDGVRVAALEGSRRLIAVLCLLALHRNGLRPDHMSALLSGEHFLTALHPREPELPRSSNVDEGESAEDEVVELCQSAPEQKRGKVHSQEQTPPAATAVTRATRDTDATRASVTHSARQLVYRIRQTSAWHDIVVSSTQSGAGELIYSLPDDTWCDIWDFEDRLSEADWHSNRPADPLAAELACMLRGQGLELYRGELDCGMVEVAAIRQEAARLHERYVGALLTQAVFWQRVANDYWERRKCNSATTLMGAMGTMGAMGAMCVSEEDAWRHAVRYYMRAVRIDLHNEAAYVGAMRCHAHLGNRVKLHRVFGNCRWVLSHDFGHAPSRLTVDAYREFAALCGGYLHNTCER